MLKKAYSKLPLFLILLFILTPIVIMFINYFKIPNFRFWYLPNFIASMVGLYVIITNIKNYKQKEYILIGILLLNSIISSILAFNPINSFIGLDCCYDSLLTFISYLGFFYCATKIKDKSKIKLIANVFIIVAVIQCILSLSKLDIIYKIFLIPKDEYYFYTGSFSFFNQFGSYLLYASIINMFLFFYSEGKEKIIYFITNSILVFTLVLNDTFSAFLAYLAILILVILYCLKYNKYKKRLILIILVFVITCLTASRDHYNLVKRNFTSLGKDLGIIIKKDNNKDNKESKEKKSIYTVGTNRGELWIKGVKYILKKPILGYGYENIYYEYYKDGVTESKPHNRYIEICQNTGIISLILFLTLFTFIIKKNIKKLRTLSKEKTTALFFVLGFLINIFFTAQFFNTTTYFYIVLGILAQNYYKGEKNERKNIRNNSNI